MTTGKQNPPDDLEFNWDVDGPPADGPNGQDPSGEEFVFEAPPDGLDYESGPEAPQDDRDPQGDDQDQFRDAQADQEFQLGNGGPYEGDEGDEGGEGGEGGEDGVPAAPERSALSKYLFPGAAVGVAALLGGGGYLGWTMLNEEQPSSGGGYAQAAPPSPQPSAQPPRLPASVGGPTLPPPALPAAQPGLPSLPGAQPSDRLPPVTPTQFPSAAAQGQSPLSGLPGLPGPAPIQQPSASVAAPAALPSGIETALVDLVGEMRKFTVGFEQLQGEVRSVRSDVRERLDLTDGKISAIGQQVSGVETRVGGIEQRLSALESARLPQPRQAPAAAPAPAPTTQTSGVNRRVAPPRPSSPAPAAAPRQQAAAPDRVLTGWTLKGVSRTEVIVEDGRGNMIRAEIGKTQVPGVGVVRQVRRFQDTWELVTASGIIRP